MDLTTRRTPRRVLVATTLAAGLLLGPTSAADAAREGDTRPCVTRAEWRAVYIVPDGTNNGPGTGGTHRRVYRIFDSWGKRVAYERSGDFAYQIRRYKRCGSPGYYRVTFHKYDGYPGWHSYWG